MAVSPPGFFAPFYLNYKIVFAKIKRDNRKNALKFLRRAIKCNKMTALPTEEAHLEQLSTISSNLFEIIPWADVLIPKVAQLLSLKDLFNLRCCSRLTKRFVEAAFERRSEINFSGNNSKHIEDAFVVLSKTAHNLKALQLARCFWLTDELLVPILINNTRLQVCNLNECENITATALQPVIIKCKDLRVLKLSKCQWVTTGAVDALTLHQSNLEEFDISHCTGIGERCLFIFFRKLNKLTVLSLANVLNVSDPVLIQIAHYCRALEHINLVGCQAVSDYGINALVNGCTQLQSLMVHRCPGVTERVLAPLRGRVHIDRPNQSYNLPALIDRLYLQV